MGRRRRRRRDRAARPPARPRPHPGAARIAGHRFLRGPGRAVIVDIGAHGFSVLELKDRPRRLPGRIRAFSGHGELPAAARGAFAQCAGGGGRSLRLSRIRRRSRPPSRHPEDGHDPPRQPGEDRARSWPACSTPSATTCRCCSARPGADAATVVPAGGVGAHAGSAWFGMGWRARDDARRGDGTRLPDALGCAVLAARGSAPLPPPDELVAPPRMPP